MTTSQDSLTAELASTLAQSRENLPAEVSAAFTADQQALDAAGIPAGIAEVGASVPDADLLTVDGATTTLHTELAGRPSVLVFYRGAWCPFCNLTLRSYQNELAPALAERGVGLIAISPQRPDGSLTTQESNDLTYTVVSDPGNVVAAGLGILADVNEDSLAAQRQLGLDVTQVNADGTPTLPMPTVVVVDAAGSVQFIDVHPNYTTRTEPSAILAAVDALG